MLRIVGATLVVALCSRLGAHKGRPYTIGSAQMRNVSLLVEKIGVFLAQIAPRFFGD